MTLMPTINKGDDLHGEDLNITSVSLGTLNPKPPKVTIFLQMKLLYFRSYALPIKGLFYYLELPLNMSVEG